MTRRGIFKVVLGGALAGAVLLMLLPQSWQRRGYHWTVGRFFRQAVNDRLKQFGSAAQERLRMTQAPEAIRILVFKEDKMLELACRQAGATVWTAWKRYPVLAASGVAGPKLREGDRQVPEGVYAVESLHPNSHFYLALKIAYPGPEDIAAARQDGRDPAQLGSAIMLHGRGGSVGCVAVSDEAIEELFWLAAQVGVENVQILIYPWDFRRKAMPETAAPAWLPERYRRLQSMLGELEGRF